jgi:kanamycin nucleotidyltransferase
MSRGPQPMNHEDRLKLAKEIASRFQGHFAESMLAIGVYGSLARGTDTAYSDIEMYCVIKGQRIDTPYEWSTGEWKAEVDVQSADVLLKWAAELDETWSLTHGSCVNILPFYDPGNFFGQLKELVFDHSDEEFESVIKDMIVGELYEFLGKIRNTVASGNTSSLTIQAGNIAKYGAFMIGLANRSLYSSSSNLLPESLALPDRPNGYDALCELVMRGELNDFPRVVQAADRFWDGVESWAKARGLKIHENLDDLLK